MVVTVTELITSPLLYKDLIKTSEMAIQRRHNLVPCCVVEVISSWLKILHNPMFINKSIFDNFIETLAISLVQP